MSVGELKLDAWIRLSPVVSGLYVENVYAMECIELVEALMRPLVLKCLVTWSISAHDAIHYKTRVESVEALMRPLVLKCLVNE